MIVPRVRFGTSLYNTPILLILRLFYQASSFGLPSPEHSDDPLHRTEQGPLVGTANFQAQTLPTKTANCVFDRFEKVSVADWWNKLSRSPTTFENHRVVSITWVKALASHLSHEFVQFVVEDPSGNRDRIIADRHENGDWIILGWNWTSMHEPSERHSLPLPLLSLTYEEENARPKFLSVAKVIADVTARRPHYNVLREMCWWYAEAIFEGAHTQFGGNLKEWPWARMRYSLVLRTRVLPRLNLSSQAEEFRKLNAREMSF